VSEKWAIKKALWWAAEKISDLGLQRWAENDITNRGKNPSNYPKTTLYLYYRNTMNKIQGTKIAVKP
jgi:hypothetical protein